MARRDEGEHRECLTEKPRRQAGRTAGRRVLAMPLFSAEAIVLRTYRLAEVDRIVVFLTRDRGKKRGVARGARRTRSRFAGALEPLTHVHVVYYEREHHALVRVREVDTVRSPLSARDLDSLGHVGYFAELMDEWAPEADPNERLYRLGVSIVDALAAGVPIDRLARYFEYWLLRLQGVYPSVFACHACEADLGDRGARVSSRDGMLLCRRCGASSRGVGLSPAAIAFLRGAVTAGPGHLAALALSRRAGRELERAHRLLIGIHLEKELKSTRVLRALAHDLRPVTRRTSRSHP